MTIINSQDQDLLGNQICPNRRIFVFWRPFWIQNGHNSKPKWSLYGAACLTRCKYPFPLKSFHFRIFYNLFWFYIGSHFQMAAIFKILKTKSITLSDDLFLCQVSKGSTVRSEFNIFCTLITMATAAILNLFNPPKAATHYGGDSYKVSWSLMIGIQNLFKSPLFCFHGNCGKVCPTDSVFYLAYLVPLDVDVVPIKFHQFLFGE